MPTNAVSCKSHQNFVKMEDIALAKVDVLISEMNLIQCITVTGNFRFIVVQGCTVLVHDCRDAFITGYDAFDRIGTLDGLNFCHGFQFGKHLHILCFTYTGHCF